MTDEEISYLTLSLSSVRLTTCGEVNFELSGARLLTHLVELLGAVNQSQPSQNITSLNALKTL